MQFKFLFALVVMGACLAQVTSAHPSNSKNEIDKGVIDDIINKAQQALEKLQKLIEEKVQEALKLFEQLKDQIYEEANAALDVVKQKMNELIAQAQAAIEAIKKKAEEAGIDISGCLTDNEDRFQQLVENLLQDETNCVKTEVDSALKILQEAAQMVVDAYATVKDLPSKLQECKNNSKPIECVKNLLVEIAKLQSDLPIQIANKVKEISQLVSGLQARLEVCAVEQLAKAGIAAAEIVADVAKCAMEKTPQ